MHSSFREPLFLPDCLHWSEGMLLSPQHLQQQEIHALALLDGRIGAVAPHRHGVLSLELDRARLARGTVALTRLECVLDDGHLALYPGNYPSTRTLECDVGAACRANGGRARVWLVLPRRGIDAGAMPGAERRFEALHGVMTGDENIDNGFQVAVARMQAQIRLHAGAAQPSQYASCALLEVVLDAQGRYALSDYHPPLLRAAASRFHDAAGAAPGLQTRLEDLRTALWAKLHELGGGRRDDAADDYAALGNDGQRRLGMARQLAAGLPQFDIAATDPQARMQDLYRALAQVVGHVAGFGADPVPIQMGPYEHEDCMPQFRRALAYVDAKLKLVNSNYEGLDFTRVGDNAFERELPPGSGRELLVELKAREGQSLADLARWLGDARIAAAGLIPALGRRRLRGASVRALGAAEIGRTELSPNAALFGIRNEQIDLDGQGPAPLFGPGSRLQIHGAPDSLAPAAIVLYRDKTPAAPALAPAAAEARDA